MGPKKAKKTKAELEEERLAREEEERKAKLAEEKRQAEEAEKKRQEEAKIAGELKVNREKQLARLQEEYTEIVDDATSKDQQLRAEERNEKLRLEWEQYREPSDEPNALIESDMNTFIALMKETSVTEVKEGMETIRRIEKISSSVEEVWANSFADQQFTINHRALSQLYILRDMIMEKINQFTIPLIRFADKVVNDRIEMNIEEIGDRVGIGMWATFNDVRPIRKSAQFENLGVQLDIPKQLLAQHEFYVYRLIRMPIIPYNLEPYTQYLQFLQQKRGGAAAPSSSSSSSSSSSISFTPADDEHFQKLSLLYSKYVVGDLIEFDILISPPREFLLRAKKWVIRDHSTNSLKIRKASYPSSVPCRMYIKVPDTVLFGDDLRIAVWSEELKDWTEDGITDYSYNENNRMIQFLIATVGTLALIRKRNIHLPMKQWSIYPVLSKPINSLVDSLNNPAAGGTFTSPLIKLPTNNTKDSDSFLPPTYEKHCRLVIEYLKEEIHIDVIQNNCYLIKPDSPVYQDLIAKPLSAGILLRKLQTKGINLLALPFDFYEVTNSYSHPKNLTLESEVIKQIAKSCNALEYSISSEWNATLNVSQIGIHVRESCVYSNPLDTNEYECILAERDEVSIAYNNTKDLGIAPGPDGIQYTLILGNEFGRKNTYSIIPYEFALQGLKDAVNLSMIVTDYTHLDVMRALSKRVTSEAKDRVGRINQSFQKTVFTLLTLIRIYSQS